MRDKILIIDLRALCIIGIKEDERKKKQAVVINITIETDVKKAAKSDSFQKALDYRALKKRVLKGVESSHYFLLEALAEHVAKIVLEEKKVFQVIVRVEKPKALRFAKSVGVEITRKRRDG